jgi:hypothetical protein
MALSKEDLERFREHVNKTCSAKVICPLCGSNDWSISGPYVTLQCNITSLGFGAEAGGGAPVVLMTCANCFLCYQFAWLPIFSPQAKDEKCKT